MGHSTKSWVKTGILAAALAIAGSAVSSLTGATLAHADSCWNHNGSLMRLVAQGNKRWFYYERPRQVLRKAGVRPGTLLFNGRKQGNRYVGTTRVFSKWCTAPLEYYAEGPVAPSQTRVTIFGTRDVYGSGCRNTGRRKTDRLVFTYSHQC